MTAPALPKILLAALSLGLGLLVAAFIWRSASTKGAAETVRIVDNRAELGELLDQRLRDGSNPVSGAAADGGPPRLLREPIDEELARSTFFKGLRTARLEWDPDAHAWQVPGEWKIDFPEHPDGGWTLRVNQQGFRKDREVLEGSPDLRMLFAGDSHTAGMVANDESFANRTEQLLASAHPQLAVEALNGGVGGTSLYEYLGVLEKCRDGLAPDVFVAVVYGGNDFSGMLQKQRFYHRRPAPRGGPITREDLMRLRQSELGAVAQEIGQVRHFLNNPEDVPVAIETAVAICAEMQRLCSESGTQLILVYLPPAMLSQGSLFAEPLARSLDALPIELEDLAVSDRIADGWLERLAEQGVAHLDLRPLIRQQRESCYWRTDHHLNLRGHRLLAEALAPMIRLRAD